MSAAPVGMNERAALWVLLAANFVIGTGVLLPVGLLDQLARELGVSIPTAGLLMTVGGAVIAVGAPLAAAFTSRIDRRALLIFGLALYVAGHAISAFAPSFTVLLITRALMIIAAGIVTPQAAATISALLPAEQRSSAISFVFLGWSMAMVAGMPMASLIGDHWGWRTAFALEGVLAAIVLVCIRVTIPRGIRVVPLSLASWGQALSNPVFCLVLLATAVNSASQFILFGYLKPFLASAVGATPGMIAGFLAWQGVWGVGGNVLASRIVGRLGEPSTVLVGLLSMSLGLALVGLAAGHLPVLLLGVLLWGAGSFSVNSVQQARLVRLIPAFASASIALNTSCTYSGQAVGSAIGGGLIAGGSLELLPWAAAAGMMIAAVVSMIAARIARRA